MLGEWDFIGTKTGQGRPMFENVKKSTRSISFKKIDLTEGCVERFDADKYQLWAMGSVTGVP
jgi:glucosylceramidase